METKGWEMQRRVRRVRKCVVAVLLWPITGLALFTSLLGGLF